MNGAEKKSALLASVQKVQQEIRRTQTLLQTMSPQAKSLIVTKDIEKLLRAARKSRWDYRKLVL